MSEFHERNLPDGLDAVVHRLEQEKALASDHELDRAKVRAMSGASRDSRRKHGFRPRIVSTIVATGLLALGAIGLGGAGGGLPIVSFTNSQSTNSQYCPDSAQGPPKAKNGSNKCGQGKTKKP